MILKENDVEAIAPPLRPLLKHVNYLSNKFLNDILSLPLSMEDTRFTSMVCGKAKMFVYALRAGNNTGRKSMNLLEYNQLESGRSKPVLDMEVKELEMLTDAWIKNLIRELRR